MIQPPEQITITAPAPQIVGDRAAEHCKETARINRRHVQNYWVFLGRDCEQNDCPQQASQDSDHMHNTVQPALPRSGQAWRNIQRETLIALTWCRSPPASELARSGLSGGTELRSRVSRSCEGFLGVCGCNRQYRF